MEMTAIAAKEDFMNSPYFRLAGFALSIKKELSLKILLLLMIVAFSILQAFMLAYGTAGVFSGAANSTIFFYYAIAAGCILIRAVLTGKQEVYTKKIAGRAKAVLRSQLVNKLIDLGLNTSRSSAPAGCSRL